MTKNILHTFVEVNQTIIELSFNCIWSDSRTLCEHDHIKQLTVLQFSRMLNKANISRKWSAIVSDFCYFFFFCECDNNGLQFIIFSG